MDLTVPGLPHAHLHGAVVWDVLADMQETLVCIIHHNLDYTFILFDLNKDHGQWLVKVIHLKDFSFNKKQTKKVYQSQ